MTRTIPGHVHSFELTKVTSSAVTFHLRPSQKARDGLAYHVGGWALATVNDATGELAIQSDWGNWSHRWNIDHLGRIGSDGRRATLTEFIGDRDLGHCDYLADKLTSREERDRFDAESTVAKMQRTLCERRLEQARAWLDYYRDDEPGFDLAADDPPHWADTQRVWCCGREEKWPLTRATARSLFDEVGELLTHDDSHRGADDFCRRFLEIEGHEWITNEPWEHTRHRPSSQYEQLLHGILPALVEACRRRVAELANDLDPAPTPGDHPDRVVVPTSR